MDGNVNLLDWYWEMPVVTRLYFTASFIITVLCALDLGVSPLHLYYSWRLISMGEARAWSHGQACLASGTRVLPVGPACQGAGDGCTWAHCVAGASIPSPCLYSECSTGDYLRTSCILATGE